ncbi:hypothetical protein ACFQ4X_13965 [Fictibacillus halophilus]|uniref:hypothetical protein n=1 Tax=Fictibacillus halophilus TaxID=1610490 RepID=UPI00363D9F7A
MSEKEMLQKIIEITQQTQQSVLELTVDVADLKVRVTNIEERVTKIEERVTNVEENMVRKSDLKYYDYKIAEHDREIFELKQQN